MNTMGRQDWDKQTKQWERVLIKTRRSLALRRRRLVQFAIAPCDVILDLGCGDGLNIMMLKELGCANVVGVDISRFALARAKKNNPGVKFVLASADHLPFPSDSFTVVLADSVFHHLVDNPGAIGEIQRVLQHGGRLCCLDPHQSLLRRLFDRVTVSPISRLIPFLRDRRRAYLAEQKTLSHWLAAEKTFFQKLEQYGFTKEFSRVDLLSVINQYRKA